MHHSSTAPTSAYLHWPINMRLTYHTACHQCLPELPEILNIFRQDLADVWTSLRSLDPLGDGTLSFDEFCRGMSSLIEITGSGACILITIIAQSSVDVMTMSTTSRCRYRPSTSITNSTVTKAHSIINDAVDVMESVSANDQHKVSDNRHVRPFPGAGHLVEAQWVSQRTSR